MPAGGTSENIDSGDFKTGISNGGAGELLTKGHAEPTHIV